MVYSHFCAHGRLNGPTGLEEAVDDYRIYLHTSYTFLTLKSTPKSSSSFKWVILKGKVIFGII